MLSVLQTGWYDLKSAEPLFSQVQDLVFVGCLAPPGMLQPLCGLLVQSIYCFFCPLGGGRNPVTARFLRHFNQIAHTDFSNTSLQLIFNTLMQTYFGNFQQPDIVALREQVVESTIIVYRTILEQLKPTPSKSHYTFNLRDLSKVFSGIVNSDPKRIQDADTFFRLWIHENHRVFQDRLINDQDRQWFDDLLATLLERKFSKRWADVLAPVPSGRILFGDYMGGANSEMRIYDEIKDPEAHVRSVTQYMVDFNESSKIQLNLVLFQDAVEHVSRIIRILRQPQGNALLLGVGGSGRKSLTRLAAHVCEYDVFTVEITKGFDKAMWRDALKKCLMGAGLQDKTTVFLFADTQIAQESFLEDINNILNSGDVPNLYGPEDLTAINEVCSLDCSRKGIAVTPINIFSQYLLRVRQNLHIALAFSPVGDIFRTRLRMFPSLVNCTTIDWFIFNFLHLFHAFTCFLHPFFFSFSSHFFRFCPWPADALCDVARSKLKEGGDEFKSIANLEQIVDLCVVIHMSVEQKTKEFLQELRRYCYVTPTSYLELIGTFKTLLQEKKAELSSEINKLSVGLLRLKETGEKVAGLQEELKQKQPLLIALKPLSKQPWNKFRKIPLKPMKRVKCLNNKSKKHR